MTLVERIARDGSGGEVRGGVSSDEGRNPGMHTSTFVP